MALQWRVIQEKMGDSGGYTGSPNFRDRMTANFQVAQKLEAYDDADPTFDGSTIDVFDALAAPGVPRVRRSIYFHAGKTIPFLMCIGKNATRDPGNRRIFTVTSSYGNLEESEQDKQDPPANLADYSPREVPSLGEVTQVKYGDINSKVCYLPTGNWFPQPFVERVPTLQLQITQYEPSIDYQTMLDRKLKVNENEYRTQPRYSWLIADVEATEAQVALDPGQDGNIVINTVAQVVYTVQLNPLSFGWKDERALLDTHFLEVANDPKREKKPITDKLGITNPVGFIATDGTFKDPQDVPDYDQWEMQPTINFGFLQI